MTHDNDKKYTGHATPAENLRQFVYVGFLAKAFHVSRQAIHGKCRRGTIFPKPAGQVECGHRIWDRAEVEEAVKIFPPSNDN